jgi:predicted flap endonuclease-1-like 5' DNA nuclease
MTALLWQTALLLLAAYFLGAWVACVIRRTFFAHVAKARSDVAPHRSPSGTALHARALGPEPVPVSASGLNSEPIPKTAAISGPQAAPTRDAAANIERIPTGEGQGAGARAVPPVATPSATAVQRAPAAPVRGPTPAAPGPSTPPPATPPRPAAQAQSTSAATAIPKPQAGAASTQGQRDAAPAAATSARPVGASAAAAASRAEAATPAPRVTAPAPVVATGVQARGAPAPSTQQSGSATGPSITQRGDDLTFIRDIDRPLQARLNQLGVRRFADIAGWRAADIARISAALNFKGRIEHENWIEQAQILANGGETFFSTRKQQLELGTAEPSSVAASAPPPPPSGRPLAPSGRAGGQGAAGPADMRRPSAALGRDNLLRINQITPEIEKLLNAQGVSRYEQIAAWGPSDVTRFDRLVGQPGRIGRENWIEQAQILARHEETAYSREFDRRASEFAGEPPRPTRLADAIRIVAAKSESDAAPATAPDGEPRGSVQSKVFAGEGSADAAATATIAAQVIPSGGDERARRRDDLKRILGIGAFIETKLNAMGITSYEQIANWSKAEVNRIGQALDLRGRIEKEKWVEQARTLSAGGQTEYSRRVERGEIEAGSSKTK